MRCRQEVPHHGLMSHEARRSRPGRPLPSVAPGPALRRCLALFAVGVAVSSAAVFVWLVTTFGERYYLVGPLDDFALLVLSGVVTAVSLAVAAVVAERRRRVPVRVSGTTMTGGTPFRDGDFTVEHGTGTVFVTVPYGEFSFTPESGRR